MASFFLLWSSFFRTTSTVASSEAPADYQPAPGRTDGVPERHSKTMDYKSVFTNLCLELQQNRSWIKGLCKNPQKSELIHWRQCLLSGGTEACIPACIHVIQRLSQPRRVLVACWHARLPAKLSKNGMRVHTLSHTGGRKKNCVYHTASEREAKGLTKTTSIFLWHLYPTPVRIVIHFYPKF